MSSLKLKHGNKALVFFLVLLGGLFLFLFSNQAELRESKGNQAISQTGNKVVAQMVNLTPDNNGEAFYLHKGEMFQVVLPENPTTGYQWMVGKGTSSQLILVEQQYLSNQTESDLVGSGGNRYMVFQITEGDSAQLVLLLRRPWEAEGERLDSFGVTIVIE